MVRGTSCEKVGSSPAPDRTDKPTDGLAEKAVKKFEFAFAICYHTTEMALIRDAMTSRPQSRSSCLDALAASASEDAVPDIGIICGALCRIHSEYTVRLLSDAAWCAAFAAPPPPAARVLIIGLGSGVPALAAARAGCRVVWALRATLAARHLEPVPTELAKANGVNIQLVRVRRWADLTRLVAHGGAFDAVITEELGDDPLADGVLGLARLSRDELLTPSGSFAPSRLRVYARLLSVTMPRRAGFDVSLFNKLRTNAAAAWQDAEHTALVEGSEGCFGLSSPVVLLDVNLNQPSEWTALLEPAGLISRAATVVDRAGVLTCVSTWAELLLPSGGVISLGPLLEKAAPPRPACTRARRQRVHYLPYERTLVEGETVELTVRVTDGALEVSAPLDPMLRASVLHRTEAPPSILESYHFPMLADESRNGAFDRALTGAIARFRSANGGRSPRVLDIGAGSGLLAMMAARAGATEVQSPTAPTFSNLLLTPSHAFSRLLTGAFGRDGTGAGRPRHPHRRRQWLRGSCARPLGRKHRSHAVRARWPCGYPRVRDR